MIDRLWLIGALLACLFGAGVISLLVFTFLRFQSRTVIFHLITELGAMFLLISAILRVVPAIRFYGDGNMLGYKFLSITGVGLLIFGLLNLSAELTARNITPIFMPSAVAVAMAGGAIMAAGMILQFPVLAGISEAIMVISAFYAAIFILTGRRRIGNRRIRRFSMWISSSVIISVPPALFRIYLWNRSVDPFGYSLPPYQLMIYLLLVNAGTLVVSGLGIVRNTMKNTGELDPDAIAAYEITPRECDIILYICQGFSNEEIGSRLFISPSTVKNHVYHIYRKTGARNKIELLNSVLNGTAAV